MREESFASATCKLRGVTLFRATSQKMAGAGGGDEEGLDFEVFEAKESGFCGEV